MGWNNVIDFAKPADVVMSTPSGSEMIDPLIPRIDIFSILPMINPEVTASMLRKIGCISAYFVQRYKKTKKPHGGPTMRLVKSEDYNFRTYLKAYPYYV